ncbi:MAG: hypothetical protein LCH85_15955 [Chloroflexi bacterium]|nr:hypothetical protein [Chloroflexota bacterium]
MRWIWGCLIILIGLLPATPAAACSMIEPTLDSLTQQADLVVVATVSSIEGDQAFFTVDTAIKGSVASEPLSVLNHEIDTDPSCKPELRTGNRFAEGSKWVLFLGPNQFDSTAVWQTISFGDYGALNVEQDQVRYREHSQEQTQALADLVSTLTNYSMAGVATATALPAGQTAEPNAPKPMPTATFDVVPIANPPQITEPPANQSSTMPWILVGIGVLAGVGTLIGWRRS